MHRSTVQQMNAAGTAGRSRFIASALAAAAVTTLLAACGGGGDGAPATQATVTPTQTPAALKTGVFIDSPVSGISWRTEKNGVVTGRGITNAAGQFQYRDGEKVIFSLGSVVIGSADAAATVHVDSVTVPGASQPSKDNSTRVGQFLQSLDKDSQKAGIDLTAVKTARLPAAGLDFTQSQQAFDSRLKTALRNAGVAASSFVSASSARTHLNQHKPTAAPTTAPTTVPVPTTAPTAAPATAPTTVPVPTTTPTAAPATAPTTVPVPTTTPTAAPTTAPTKAPTANPDFASCRDASTASDPAYTACMKGTYTGKTLAGETCTVTYDGPNGGMRYTAGALQAAAKAGNFDRPNYNFTRGSYMQTWINYADDKTLSNGELFITSAYFKFRHYDKTDHVIDVKYREAGSTKGTQTSTCIIRNRSASTTTPTAAPTAAPTATPVTSNPDFASCRDASTASDPAYTACMKGTYTGKTLAGETCTVTYDGPNGGMRYTAGALQAAAKAGNFDRPNYNFTRGSYMQTWINYADDKTLSNGELFITSAYFKFRHYDKTDHVVDVKYREAGSTKGTQTSTCIIRKRS